MVHKKIYYFINLEAQPTRISNLTMDEMQDKNQQSKGDNNALGSLLFKSDMNDLVLILFLGCRFVLFQRSFPQILNFSVASS